LQHDSPCSLRYPKSAAEAVQRTPAPIELGRAEVLEWGADCMLIACGTLLPACVKAARTLQQDGLDVGVINARFVKPLDRETLLRALEAATFVITVEEGCLMGGFGSALVEEAVDAGVNTSHIRRLGIPDRFIEHGERGELLSDLDLTADKIAQTARDLALHYDLSMARRTAS
jgi:1-deoxy-D-xylulose-5-phosphate synthase